MQLFTIPLLFLLVLQLSGSDGWSLIQTVGEDKNISIACKRQPLDPDQCQFVDWSFENNNRVTPLFRGGQRSEGDSFSVSLGLDCSLVVHRVTVEQTGFYICRLHNESDRKSTFHRLQVASVSQEKEEDRVTLTCSVTGYCQTQTVTWLNSDEEVTKDHPELQLFQRSVCKASVMFKDRSRPPDFYQTLKCVVNNTLSGQTFALSPDRASLSAAEETAGGWTPVQTVREGDDVTVSCSEEPLDPSQCQFLDWRFERDELNITLFSRGQRSDGVSFPVSLGQDCSLVIPRVTVEQMGSYICQLYSGRDVNTTYNDLYVALFSQQKEEDRVTLTCSVIGPCLEHSLKWLNNDRIVTGDHEELQFSRSPCEASVSFKDQSPPSQFYQTLKCVVKNTVSKQIIGFSPRPPAVAVTPGQ